MVKPATGASLFIVGIGLYYGVTIWFLDLSMSARTRSDMVFLPWLAAVGVAVGSMLFFRARPSTVFVDARGRILVYGVTLLFLVFCVVTMVTAPSVPLLDAFRGATPEQIAVSRENFLKARVGWAAILPYLNILLAGALLPYCICVAILRRYRFRWVVLGIFFLYTLAFVEKAFFLRLFIPLMAIVAVSGTKRFKLTWLLAAAVLLLFMNTLISGFAESSGMNARDFLVYRGLYIPSRTVTDSLDYWWKSYQGQLLLGATNLMLSQIMGPRGSTAWRHAFVATFPGASNDERPMAEEAAAWADVAPSFLEIGRSDALTDLDRILDDNDDVYIGLPSAPWLIYRELRRQNVTVSLDGHGADELMGAYLQEGQLAAFRIRNAAAALTSRSQLAQRGIDFLRAQMIRREGHYFLRGGVAAAPAPLPLVAEDDELPDTCRSGSSTTSSSAPDRW